MKYFIKAPFNWFQRLGLRFKIMGMIVGLVILFSFLITFQMRNILSNTLATQLEQRGISIARDVGARSANDILFNNAFAVHELLRDTIANNIDVRYVFVIDLSGNILAHTFENGFPKGVEDANHLAKGEMYHTELLDTEEGRVRDIAVPILEGRAGIARIGITDRSLQQAVWYMTWQVILTTIIISILGILGAFYLTRILMLPIRRLVDASNSVALGDLTQKVTPISQDEIGLLSSSFNGMTASLEQYDLERDTLLKELQATEITRKQVLEKVISVQEDERKRISRELHDETSQSLTSVMVGLRLLESHSVHEDNKRSLCEMREVVASTLDEIRNMARQLRPSVLDDLGLFPAIQRYIADYPRRFGLDVDLHVRGLIDQRLNPQIEIAAYRIIQEALTNIARHAIAENACVIMEHRQNQLLIVIEDDGIGFNTQEFENKESGLGIFGMKERAALAGGSLVIETKPGTGTSLYLKIPLEEDRYGKD